MRRPDPALLRLIVFVGSLIAVLVVLIVFRRIFQPMLLGLGAAYLLDPAVSWFEKKGSSRLFGVVIIVALLLLLVVGLLLWVVPEIDDQIDRLEERLPKYSQRLRAQVEPLLNRLEARYPEEIEELQQRVIEGMRENLPELATSIGKWAKKVFSNLFELFLFLLNLIFVPVFAFYMMVDFPKIKRGVSGLIPLPYRAVTVARVTEVDQAIASFLRGQLAIALILATINAIGLMILDVPFGLLIGTVAGLANMIPYMALVVGLLPALVLCWAEHQSVALLFGVVAVFGGAQLLEGTVLSPRILGKSVNLHPVWVLLAVIAGGSLLGFFGMLIAVPVAAAIQVFARHWLDLYRSSALYREPAAGDESKPAQVSG